VPTPLRMVRRDGKNPQASMTQCDVGRHTIWQFRCPEMQWQTTQERYRQCRWGLWLTLVHGLVRLSAMRSPVTTTLDHSKPACPRAGTVFAYACHAVGMAGPQLTSALS
jgi:hypothetical protein